MAKQNKFNKKTGNGKSNGGNFRGKGNTNNSKPQFHCNDKGEATSSQPRENDISWYNKYPEVLSVVDRIPFTFALGDKLPEPVSPHVDYSNFAGNALPGAMILRYYSTFGSENNADSALNIIGRDTYTSLRKGKSTTTNYKSPDVMMYILGMSEIHAWLAELRRVYGVLALTTPINRYSPRHLTEMLGFDYDDLVDHITQFRGYYNLVCTKLNKYYMPSELNILKRRIWMNESIFLDGSTFKSQMYAFKPQNYWVYSDTFSDEGGCLISFAHRDLIKKYTYDDIRRITDQMVTAMTGSNAQQNISADIAYVYGEKVLIPPMMAETYTTTPVYSREVNSQIENATIMPYIEGLWAATETPGSIDDPVLILKQNQNNFVSGSFVEYNHPIRAEIAIDGTYGFDAHYVMDSVLLNLHDNTDSAAVTVASRLTVLGVGDPYDNVDDSGITRTYQDLAFGTEIITDVAMYTLKYTNAISGGVLLSGFSLLSNFSPEGESLSFDNVYKNMQVMQLWNTFDWAPKLRVSVPVFNNEGTAIEYHVLDFCDYANVGLLTGSVLDNLNKVILLSEFSS